MNMIDCVRAKKAEIEQDFYEETEECEKAFDYGRIRVGCLCDECMNCEWKDDARTEWQDSLEEAIEQWNEMMEDLNR